MAEQVAKQEKPKKKKIKLNIIAGFIVAIIATCLLVSSVSTVFTRISLAQQAKIVEEELAKLQDENDELSSIKAKLEDENYVVTYARGEYMFSKGDEKLFKLPSKK